MTTLVALKSPAQVDYLVSIQNIYISDAEQTYVVHAPATPTEREDWSRCQSECIALGDSWEFRFAREEGSPARQLIEFASGHAIDRIILVAPNRTVTGKVDIGSTTMNLLLANSIRGTFTIDGDFLILDDLTYLS